MNRPVQCNRKCVMKVYYQSISHAMSFTQKVLQLYKKTDSFYLKYSSGSKEELKEITQ